MKRKQLGFLIVVLLAISIIAHGDSGDEHGAGGVEELIKSWMANRHIIWLFAIIAVTIYTLGKGADWLVEEAVTLSTRWGVPTTLVGATIVSMGTTMPEAAVSVLAAVKGSPGLALGNAVGSIICDTGLVLGTAALIAPLPLNRMIVNRQGWLQLGAGFLLVLACIPYDSLGTVFSGGGKLPQFMGFVFLVLLVAYMWQSIRWAPSSRFRDACRGGRRRRDWYCQYVFCGGQTVVCHRGGSCFRMDSYSGCRGSCTEIESAGTCRCGDVGRIWNFSSGICNRGHCRKKRTWRAGCWQRHRCRYP